MPHPSRRAMLAGAAALPLAGMAPLRRPVPDPFAAGTICRVADPRQAPPSGAPRKLKLTWNANSVCTVGVPVAQAQGLFQGHGLEVELVNFGGSTDQLLEAISTGKADAGVGMALRWLKPLEQGFDVKFTTAIHGGCLRLFAPPGGPVRTVSDLRGRRVGVSDMAAPEKNFFSIAAARQGIDPNRDIEWRQYPADLLGIALRKGEVDAFALGDPLGWMVRERDGLVEVSNNLAGDYAHRACCVLGVRGGLVRQDRAAAAALTRALLDAQEWVVAHPDQAAAIYAAFSPVPAPMLAAILRSHAHHHHPSGDAFRAEIADYVQELKLVQVIRPSTNPARFAEKVTVDVLAS